MVHLPLWMMDNSKKKFLVFWIKLRWYFMFQGPPSSLLHHVTSSCESDSRTILVFFVLSLAMEIETTHWMAKISAQLISINSIGDEKRQTKLPLWSRKTPPIAEPEISGLTEVLMFHLMWDWFGGFHTSSMYEVGLWLIELPFSIHIRHDGFLWMSKDEYGNLSHHPLIHQPSLRSTMS